MADKRTITFRYERSVLVGSEARHLRDVLNDISLLREDSTLGAAYRKLYGSSSRLNLEKIKRIAATGQPVLVTSLDGVVPSRDEIGDATDYHTITARDLADNMNRRAGFGSVPDADLPRTDAGAVRQFVPSDFILDAQGQWKKTGPDGRTAQRITQKALGATPTQVTLADLEKMQRLNADAAALGIDPKDLLRMHRIRGDARSSVTGTLSVYWHGDQVEEAALALGAEEDPLRSFAPRPGGQNYVRAEFARTAPDLTSDGDQPPMELVQVNDGFGPAGNRNPSANTQKKDSYAALRVISGFSNTIGNVLETNDKDFQVKFQTNRFLVDSASESQAERMALIETFGETYMYVFGERPRMYSYSGTLMDTEGLNWLNEWREAYRTRFRATATLKLKARAFFVYRDVAREGIIVANINAQSAAELGIGRFSFQMFVMREYFLAGRPEIDAQLGSSVNFLSKTGPEESTDANYEVQFIDTTQLDQSKIADALSANERAAARAEDAAVARHRTDIESQIKAAAFSKGKYLNSSGAFELSLAAAELEETSAAAVSRLKLDGTMMRPPRLIEVK